MSNTDWAAESPSRSNEFVSTPSREAEIDAARTATSAAALLFPEYKFEEDDVSDSGMAESAFGGSRSVFEESSGKGFVPTAEDVLLQQSRANKRAADLRSEASSRTLENSIEIFSEDDLEPYIGEIAPKLKAFVESNKFGNKIFPGVLVGICCLNGRLLFKRSASFEVKKAMANLGVITNLMSDDSGSEFYMYNTRFVIPPAISRHIAPVSGASISQLPAVVHPSLAKPPAAAGGSWKKLSSHENLLSALDMDFTSLDFKTLMAVRSALMKMTSEVDGIYTKKRAEMQALLDETA
jgi:hypothetical protein